jgi:SAM-dependent methyltransferase
MNAPVQDIVLHDEQASYGLHKNILDLLQKEQPGRLLDVGCGTGFFAKKVRERWDTEVHVAEYRREFVRYEGLQVSEVDLNLLQRLPYEDDSFDYIVLIEVIEHVKHPWFLMEELARILRPGGKIFLTTPNVHHLGSKLKVAFGSDFWGFNEETQSSPLSHLISFTVRQLRLIMNECGLTVERVQFSHPFLGRRIIFSEEFHERSLFWRWARYFVRNSQYLLCCLGSVLLARSPNPDNIHFGASVIIVGIK